MTDTKLREALMAADLAMANSGFMACHGVRKHIAEALTAPAAEPEPQATPIPCAVHVAGRTFEAGTSFCDVIEHVESTRLRGGVPDGWKLERKESDDRIVLTSPTGDAWSWADRVPGGGTSGEFVYLFLSALLDAAQPISMRGGVPEIDYPELIRAAVAKNRKWAQGTNGCIAFARGAEWFREQALTAAPQAPALDAGVVRDAERLDWLDSEADDLRAVTTGEDDYDWVVISHHMAKPHEREIGRGKTARAAIDAAMSAQGGGK